MSILITLQFYCPLRTFTRCVLSAYLSSPYSKYRSPYSKYRRSISAAARIELKSLECRESNQGLLGEKRERYLCAMLQTPCPVLIVQIIVFDEKWANVPSWVSTKDCENLIQGRFRESLQVREAGTRQRLGQLFACLFVCRQLLSHCNLQLTVDNMPY